MTNGAKAYIASVAVAGIALLAAGVFQREFSDLPRFFLYGLLALVASTLKVRLPRITGTISVNFLFLLIAIADFSFSEAVLLGAAAALLQSVWKAKPKPVQILFNVACLALSIGVAYWGSHFVLAAARTDLLAVLMGLAACLLFVTNTGLVAGVLSLVEHKPLGKVWRQCHAWSFPYYLVGAAIAGLICVASRSAGWKASLLVLPMMYLTYLCYRLYVERTAQEQSQPTSAAR